MSKGIIVLPTYNEKNDLEPLVEDIWRYTPDVHILVVDDNSPDGTGKLAEELSERYPGRVRVLHRSGKQGLERAYVHAFSSCIGPDGMVRWVGVSKSH